MNTTSTLGVTFYIEQWLKRRFYNAVYVYQGIIISVWGHEGNQGIA